MILLSLMPWTQDLPFWIRWSRAGFLKPGLVGYFFQPILDTESAIFADAMESEYMNSHGALDVAKLSEGMSTQAASMWDWIFLRS